MKMEISNGYTNFFKPDGRGPTITVYARVAQESDFTSDLQKGRFRFPEMRIAVRPNFVLVEKYRSSISESWFVAPYYLSITVINSFMPLMPSIIIAMIIQFAIISVIILLVIAGCIDVFPSVG